LIGGLKLIMDIVRTLERERRRQHHGRENRVVADLPSVGERLLAVAGSLFVRREEVQQMPEARKEQRSVRRRLRADSIERPAEERQCLPVRRHRRGQLASKAERRPAEQILTAEQASALGCFEVTSVAPKEVTGAVVRSRELEQEFATHKQIDRS